LRDVNSREDRRGRNTAQNTYSLNRAFPPASENAESGGDG